jgi:hypothetical protein
MLRWQTRISLAGVNRSETLMSAGNVLYLLMCIGMFTTLSGVLAYQSWREGSPGPDPSDPVPEDDSIDPVPGHALNL